MTKQAPGITGFPRAARSSKGGDSAASSPAPAKHRPSRALPQQSSGKPACSPAAAQHRLTKHRPSRARAACVGARACRPLARVYSLSLGFRHYLVHKTSRMPITHLGPLFWRNGCPQVSYRRAIHFYRCQIHSQASVNIHIHSYKMYSLGFRHSVRELRNSPERSRELADHLETAAHCPRDLHPTSHHSRGPGARG